MRRSINTEVNAGSMADIAFLLLLFFLVATTIKDDSGIVVRLPPYIGSEPAKLSKDRVITVLVNAEGQALIEDDITDISDVSEDIKNLIEDRLLQNVQPVLSLQVDRKTTYADYLSVYNELKYAFRSLRTDYALSRLNKPYHSLNLEEQRDIHKLVPMIISEAEPYVN